MKKMMLVAGVMATAGWFGFAPAAEAQQAPQPSAPPGAGAAPAELGQPASQAGQQRQTVPMNPKNDQQFLEWAATRNAMEVEMGQMAARKAPSQQVRQFGQMLATDHGRNNAKAMPLIREMNITLPETMAPQDHKTIEEFTRLKGQQFDQRFVQHEVKDHEHVIKIFQKFAKDAQNPQVRQFAEQTIPVLEKHLAAAKRLAGAEKGNAGAAGHSEEQEHQPAANGANHGKPGSKTGTDKQDKSSNQPSTSPKSGK